MSVFINPEIYSRVIFASPDISRPYKRCEREDNPCNFIANGVKYLAPIIAFLKIVIWLLAIEVVMKDLLKYRQLSGICLRICIGHIYQPDN